MKSLKQNVIKDCVLFDSIVIMPSETSLSSGNAGINNVTQPFVTETYRCIATYETKDTKNRPFKVEVDETVDVLIKDQKGENSLCTKPHIVSLQCLLTLFYFVSSGWWLVENEAKNLAWFPAPYLQRAEMDDDGPDVMDGASKYRFRGFYCNLAGFIWKLNQFGHTCECLTFLCLESAVFWKPTLLCLFH